MAIVSSEYAEAEAALAASTIMSAMMTRSQFCIDITLMTDEELASGKIATRDEDGSWVPDDSFVNEANGQFRLVNEAPQNAKYKYAGWKYGSTVASVILAEREKQHAIWRECIDWINEHLGISLAVPGNATPRELKAVFDEANDAFHSSIASKNDKEG